MKARYIDKTFHKASLALISDMSAIVEDYEAQGFRLTVRQLYYQLVTRNRIANSKRDYERVVRLCADARLAGLMDWDMIEDRGREWIRRTHWRSGAHILQAAADSYHQDRWENQEARVFVVVEKDALSGVLAPVCSEFDIPLLAARGYASVTVLREFAVNDIIPALTGVQSVIVLHLADHDPSGLDMTRDIKERLGLFVGRPVLVRRIALNMDQVEELRPPENPAKESDNRFTDYARKFGPSSWELDALPPDYLARLVRGHAAEFIDPDRWEASEHAIAEIQASLKKLADGFRESAT